MRCETHTGERRLSRLSAQYLAHGMAFGTFKRHYEVSRIEIGLLHISPLRGSHF